MINENLEFIGKNAVLSGGATVRKPFGLSIFCLLAVVFIVTGVNAQLNQNNATRLDPPVEPVKTGRKTIETEPAAVVMAPATAAFTEGFDGGTVPAGWSIQNLSSPVGTNTNCWNPFTTTPWAPQAGSGHIGANFNCTSGANTISGWLFSPVIMFQNGDQIKFWTRKGSPDTFPDRLELRLSTNGASVNAGASSTTVGDFSTLLLSVNPTLVTGVYPTTFTQFTATITGLGGPTSGRVAFRYFVTNGGPSGANSDIISIDTFDYIPAVTTAAGVTAAGVVSDGGGRAVSRAIVQLIDQAGNTRTARTNSFGRFQFEDVPAGENYVINVFSKGLTFNSQIVNLTENAQDLNFTANE